MKIKRITLISLTLITFALYSGCTCGPEGPSSENAEAKTEVNPENLLAIDLEVDGMVCAQGCAKTIEKKVGDMTGIAKCEVDFEGKKAHIEFDRSQLEEKDIISTITSMHDGQYKVNLISSDKPAVEEKKESGDPEEIKKTAYENTNSRSGNKFIFTEIITYFTNGF